jgi:hypothetical protein
VRLGRKQLGLLAGMAGVGSALVVPDKLSRSLCRRGLMEATGAAVSLEGEPREPGMLVVTPAGLRAVADAMEAGQVEWRPDWAKIRERRKAAE